jgi:hypothetical protein
MRSPVLFFMLLIFILQNSGYSFSIPNVFWPQKDLPTAEYNKNSTSSKVLIASRKSSFKKAFVTALVDSLQKDSVYIKVTGISSINKEDLQQYDAIVFVNTNMAWSMDSKVVSALKKHPELKNFIVVTTAGDPHYKQKKSPNTFDALSSCSVASNLDNLVSRTLHSIYQLTSKQQSTR